MRKNLVVLAAIMLASCSKQETVLHEWASPGLDELSALQYVPLNNTLWAIQDAGNGNKLYNIVDFGHAVIPVTVKGAENTDWEALAADADGHLYIGDFGNNGNKRKDLAIYRVNPAKPDTIMAKINFYYPEQTEFPPKKSKRIYDCEAFFVHKKHFYLFTKNRSAKFDGSLNVYKVPNIEGNHKAELIGTMKTCSVYNKCAITGADISPDGSKAILVSGDKLFVITGFGEDNFANANMKVIALGHESQKEAVCFTDNNTLLIADEKEKATGGKIYKLLLSDYLKAKP